MYKKYNTANRNTYTFHVHIQKQSIHINNLSHYQQIKQFCALTHQKEKQGLTLP